MKLFLVLFSVVLAINAKEDSLAKLEYQQNIQEKFLYEDKLRKSVCDMRLSKIDYRCDMGYDATDSKFDALVIKIERFCKAGFKKLNSVCNDKVWKDSCKGKFKRLEDKCNADMMDAEDKRFKAYSDLDMNCDRDYANYDKDCSKKNRRYIDVSRYIKGSIYDDETAAASSPSEPSKGKGKPKATSKGKPKAVGKGKPKASSKGKPKASGKSKAKAAGKGKAKKPERRQIYEQLKASLETDSYLNEAKRSVDELLEKEQMKSNAKRSIDETSLNADEEF